MSETLSTSRQIIKAASACIWRDGKVLLVRRGKALGKGLWSLPGGKCEPQETFEQTAIREAHEETAMIFTPHALIGIFYINTNTKTYEIHSFTGTCGDEEAIAGDDADAMLWTTPTDAEKLPLAPNTLDAIAKAQDLMRV